MQQARALVTGAPFAGAGDSPLYADANAKIAALVASGKITAARGDELRAATASALTERFKPAYDALIAWAEVGPREHRRGRDGRLEAAGRARVLRGSPGRDRRRRR